MLAPDEAARRLIALADRVRDLSVRRRSPHAFFEERSEIDLDLRKLAGEIAGRAEACRNPIERGRFRVGAIVAGGRFVAVEQRAPRRISA